MDVLSELQIVQIIMIMGIPSAVTGFCFWIVERRLVKRDADRKEQSDKKEKLMEQNQFLILQSVNASMALAEATARAVERIPDAHCNGDMHAALDYAAKVKREQKEFLTKLGIQNIIE